MRKRRVVGRIYGVKYSRKGHKNRNRHKNRIKTGGQAQLVDVKDINREHPHHVKVGPWGSTIAALSRFEPVRSYFA